jgi:ABC-type phosphate/phosphonate transport system substrate-binding protein
MSRASLPMYDLPELRGATDAWWAGLARAFRRAGVAEPPATLERPRDMAAAWRAPELLFSQTCGYPLTHQLKQVVQTVATPAYSAPGCDGARYVSVVVVRADDPAAELAALRGATCAFNALDSQSGYNALRRLIAPLAVDRRFFGKVVVSGGHAASLAAVAGKRADVAAVDCVTFALLARCRPDVVEDLRVLSHTEQAPGLPYVTSRHADGTLVDRLRDGLFAALADPDLAAARDDLLIAGAEALPLEAYGRIDGMEAEAQAHGYPEIA